MALGFVPVLASVVVLPPLSGTFITEPPYPTWLV
jgi:hypothetical protein